MALDRQRASRGSCCKNICLCKREHHRGDLSSRKRRRSNIHDEISSFRFIRFTLRTSYDTRKLGLFFRSLRLRKRQWSSCEQLQPFVNHWEKFHSRNLGHVRSIHDVQLEINEASGLSVELHELALQLWRCTGKTNERAKVPEPRSRVCADQRNERGTSRRQRPVAKREPNPTEVRRICTRDRAPAITPLPPLKPPAHAFRSGSRMRGCSRLLLRRLATISARHFTIFQGESLRDRVDFVQDTVRKVRVEFSTI